MQKNIVLTTLCIMLFAVYAQAQTTFFEVTVENIGVGYTYPSGGIFNTPVGATDPAPIFPGEAYEFEVWASPGSYLTATTMYVQSNDILLAPDEEGIPLWDEDGNQMSGDITSFFSLWDAGTEVNEAPGEGANQAPRQAGPDTGDDENGTVRLIDDGFTYAAVDEVALITIEPTGDYTFTVRIENVSNENTQPITGGSVPVPLSPGAWVVHSEPGPFFTSGEADRGLGLEAIAEDGDPAALGAYLQAMAGVTPVFAPGVWATHTDAQVLFSAGAPDRGEGLEGLAEDGTAGPLAEAVNSGPRTTAAAFAVPDGSDGPGPLTPGNQYRFTIGAKPGSYFSLASMLVQTNDLFIAPDEMGIPLWDADGNPLEGDITDQFLLWDAGTEVNELPGFGINQAPRQSGPDTGDDENGVVQVVDDGFTYPDLTDIVQVSIRPLSMVEFTVRIENVSTESTLNTSTGQSLPVPFAPGVWVVHSTPAPLFSDGEADRGLGLEGLAEDGAAGDLGDALGEKIGYASGVFNTPVGATDPGPLTPGNAYEFTVTASPGTYLSFATMMVQSNDLFVAPDEMGIPLWDEGGFVISGDLTDQLLLWDAGTEVNEEPGEGANQAPRQAAGNTGDDENGVVQLVNDGFTYPTVGEMVMVTVVPTETATEEISDVPNRFQLNQNYPNPFNPETRIQFSLDEAGPARLTVFNLLGQEVAELHNGFTNAGTYQVTWNGHDQNGVEMATGVYLYRLDVAGRTQIRKMTLLR